MNEVHRRGSAKEYLINGGGCKNGCQIYHSF